MSEKPDYDDPRLVAYVASKMRDAIMPWYEYADYGDEANAREDVYNLLKENWYYGKNGYDLAKDLEYDGFSPDAEMVEELEHMNYLATNKYRQLVAEWVAENKIQPPYKVGQNVRYKWGSKNKEYVGEIYGIDQVLGQYDICCRDEGHVLYKSPEYEALSKAGKSIDLGHCVDYENVIEVL